MNIRVLPSEQDDIIKNSLNYEGIAVVGYGFTFLMTDCVLALSQTK